MCTAFKLYTTMIIKSYILDNEAQISYRIINFPTVFLLLSLTNYLVKLKGLM